MCHLYLLFYYNNKLFCVWSSIINHLLSTAMKTLNLKYFGVTILIFRGHLTSSERDHRTRRGHFPIGNQWWLMTMRLSCTDTEIWGFKDFGVMSLTFWGYVTSSVMWPFDSAYVVSYWWSIVTMRLSCTITEIWGPKDIGVTPLTFWVTWHHSPLT